MNYLSKGVGYFDKWFWVKSRVKSDHEYDIARPQFAADDEIQQSDKNSVFECWFFFGYHCSEYFGT